MVLLHETGREDDVEIVSAGGTPLDPGTQPLDANPLGKIPVLGVYHTDFPAYIEHLFRDEVDRTAEDLR